MATLPKLPKWYLISLETFYFNDKKAMNRDNDKNVKNIFTIAPTRSHIVVLLILQQRHVTITCLFYIQYSNSIFISNGSRLKHVRKTHGMKYERYGSNELQSDYIWLHASIEVT